IAHLDLRTLDSKLSADGGRQRLRRFLWRRVDHLDRQIRELMADALEQTGQTPTLRGADAPGKSEVTPERRCCDQGCPVHEVRLGHQPCPPLTQEVRTQQATRPALRPAL